MRGGKRTLTRGGRIGRNLALTALMGGMIWLGAGAPAPTAELALRRLERESFLSPHSQYQGEAAGPGAFQFRFVIGDGDEPWGAREAAIQDTALQKAAEWRLYQGQDLPQSLPLRCRGTAVFYDAGGRELGRAVLESRDSQGICVP